jgi:hypothetical protein
MLLRFCSQKSLKNNKALVGASGQQGLGAG